MNRRIGYYAKLTALDIFRLWPSVQHHVIIVAGICLPILLLLGLKNGEVSKLRQKIVANPDATEVIAWNDNDIPFNGAILAELRDQTAGLHQAIPSIDRLVSVSRKVPDGETIMIDKLTASATAYDDPKVAALGCPIKHNVDDRSPIVMIKDTVAEKLGAQKGDTIRLHVQRALGDKKYETAILDVTLAEIYYPEGRDAADLFVSDHTMLNFLQFGEGGSVEEFDWPALNKSAKDTYLGYLLFSKKNQGGLTDEDRRTLDSFKYTVDQIDSTTMEALHACFKPGFENELDIYLVQPKNRQGKSWGFVEDDPRELTDLTSITDAAIFWNAPKTIQLDGSEYLAVGLTVPRRSWLRKYIDSHELTCFNYRDATRIIALAGSKSEEKGRLTLDNGITVPVQLRTRPTRTPVNATPPKSPGTPATPESNASPQNRSDAATFNEQSQTSNTTNDVDQSDRSVKDTSSDLPAQDPQNRIAEIAQVGRAPGPNDPAPQKDTKEVLEADADIQSSDRVDDLSTSDSDITVGDAAESTTNATADEVDPQVTDELKIAVFPIDLLAYLYHHEQNRVQYDPITGLFIPIYSEAIFTKLRAYASDIDQVPVVVGQFQKLGYLTDSNVSLIKELGKNTSRLEIIVLIVGIGVYFFGTITVVSLLLDSTARKKGTIGIMRVMGVSRFGIFFTVFMRATIIAVLAALVTVILGFAFKFMLMPIITINIGHIDIVYVVLGAIICCSLGSLLPAFHASRMDPFDAIVEGRFR